LDDEASNICQALLRGGGGGGSGGGDEPGWKRPQFGELYHAR